MNLARSIAAIVATVCAASSAAAQTRIDAQGDTVVLIVKSPRGEEVAFTGTIVLRDAKTTRRIENVRTPFELRLAKQDFDASFAAADGGALNGEIVVFKAGEQSGHAWGTVYRGEVKLHYQPRGSFGFGGRQSVTRLLP
jgi:hypothetical protein